MRKKVFSICLSVLFLTMLFMEPVSAAAPYITWTSGPDHTVVDTQTAYSPENVLDYGLNAPEDFFIDSNHTMYICDTGNSRILVVDSDGNVREYQDDVLNKPTGIYVSEGHIYIADNGLNEVLVYTDDFQLEKRIGRPTEAIFGESTKYAPKKLLTDSRGNLYVVSDGSISGLMQFNGEGEFLGYFGSNSTNTTLKIILQRTFFTEEQLNKLFKNTPPSVTNIAIDQQGLIYTVTSAATASPLKKLNISGVNLFDPDMFNMDHMLQNGNYIDVDVDLNGNTYAVTSTGVIFEYDKDGGLLFAFGGQDSDYVRVGILKEPVAIEITDDEQLYILDKGQNCIIHYSATEFAKRVHQGIAMYNDGKYEESESIWQDIRKMNSSFIMAYEALAKADYKKQNYESALYNFRIAENKEGYSQTYWVYRNLWLKNNLGYAVLILVLLCVIWKVIKTIDRKKGILGPVRALRNRISNIEIVSQVCYLKKMLKNPMDAYYEIKFLKKAGIASATVLYIWLFILQLTDIYVVSYLFNTSDQRNLNLLNELLWVVAPVALFVICNYLVSTITEGEGKVRDLYIGTVYAMAPYLIFALPLQILTHVLTLNEGFVYEFGMVFFIAWSVILFIMMVKEMHDYTLGKTFKNLAVTAFTIALFLLTGFIIYLLFGQLRDFISSIIQEVAVRV